MTPEELLRAWHEDPEKHVLIYCFDWTPAARGVRVKCEACGRAMTAWPTVAEQAGQPRIHLLCRSKCLPIGVRVTGPQRFGGTVTDNKVPADLQRFIDEARKGKRV